MKTRLSLTVATTATLLAVVTAPEIAAQTGTVVAKIGQELPGPLHSIGP